MTDHARRAVVVGAPLLAWLAIQPFAAQLPVGVVLPLALLVTGVLPGLAIAGRVTTGWRSEERFALAALLSPALVSAVSLVTRSLGGTERLAVTIVVAMIAFVSLAPGSAPSAPVASREARRPVWPFVLAALLAAAHLASAALAWRSDGAFHAGVVHALARGVSPEDPFLAGLPLRYFWGWHGWAACVLATVPQIPATLLLASSSVLAFAAALVGVSSLAASLGAEARARGWAIVLLLVGAAPFAWLTLAGHALVGETRGLAELEPVLAHGGDLALRALDPGFLHPSLVLPLDKFVVVTPFAWGLAGAFMLVRVLTDALAQANVRAGSAVALTSAAIVFLHPAAGLLLVVASAVALLALAAAGRVTWRAAGVALVTCALGALAALPYLAHLAPAGGGGATALRFGLDARGALSVVWGGLVLLPLAWLALRRADSTPGALVGGQLAVLLVPALILRAGGDNQSKALNLAFALAAAPAAIALAAWTTTRARRIAALGLAILAWAPALAAMLFAYAHEGQARPASRRCRHLRLQFRHQLRGDAVSVDDLHGGAI